MRLQELGLSHWSGTIVVGIVMGKRLFCHFKWTQKKKKKVATVRSTEWALNAWELHRR